MDFGKVRYAFLEHPNGNGLKRLHLTLIGQGDAEALKEQGIAGLRRKRILRLASEAQRQGCLLGYEDLSSLLLTSLATLKRDVNSLEKSGHSIPLRGRRKNGNGGNPG